MSRAFSLSRALFGVLMVGGIAAAPARAQNSPVPFDEALTATTFAAPGPSGSTAMATSTVSSSKPTVMVMGFESGTVAAQSRERRGLRGLFGGRSETERYEPSQLGTGIADMLIEKLLESGQFRVLERKPLDAGSGAQFIVTGSVTKFGFEENNFGGIAANVATMGLLSFKQHKTEVTLTARVINVATGEIVA
ncbi:MAG: hypothetical protein QOH22_1868, partial [Gemmatimonadaceae bacterium]|nr:hypothetical protein [Gemmatimonadaceae bacterium]